MFASHRQIQHKYETPTIIMFQILNSKTYLQIYSKFINPKCDCSLQAIVLASYPKGTNSLLSKQDAHKAQQPVHRTHQNLTSISRSNNKNKTKFTKEKENGKI